MERYLTFCSAAGDRESLLQRFESLSLAGNDGSTAGTEVPGGISASPPSFPEPSASAAPNGAKDLSDVIMALRKLREGIVASKRADDFATQAYLFCIRFAILVRDPESYHPAVLHLLRAIHPQHPLTSVELHEITAYLVLDTACRRADLAEARALRVRYGLRDAKVDAVLAALVHDNYVVFRRVTRSVDRHWSRLMEYAEEEMRRHTLKCIGRTYLSVELGFLEGVTGCKWDELTTKEGVGWELEGQKVVIRKVRAK